MTLGERIANLRKESGYSQEYIAEQLEVSRQAVSKWEKDMSSPDTGNLIKLAKLLNTSVQFLATGKDFYFPEGKPAPEKKKINIKKLILVVIGTIAGLLFSAYVLVGLFGPVSVDSAACSGGYKTFLYEKYSEEFSNTFLENLDDYDERHPVFISAKPRGSEHFQMSSFRRNVNVTITVIGETEVGNEYPYSVIFKGKRIWYDTYKWELVSVTEMDPLYIFNKST
ncbi:MAG: helix-turn-helix transcriptional regulator [Oscillospiraceae bacterium]|nr:helix-turn-helix transcriptional regulator [Oscillospiraceae bacterium]